MATLWCFHFFVFKSFCYIFACSDHCLNNQVLTFWQMAWGLSSVFLDNFPPNIIFILIFGLKKLIFFPHIFSSIHNSCSCSHNIPLYVIIFSIWPGNTYLIHCWSQYAGLSCTTLLTLAYDLMDAYDYFTSSFVFVLEFFLPTYIMQSICVPKILNLHLTVLLQVSCSLNEL